MRWDNLRLDDDALDSTPLFARDTVARTFDTPGFRGMTFYEVRAKSIVSHVPGRLRARRSTRPGSRPKSGSWRKGTE